MTVSVDHICYLQTLQKNPRRRPQQKHAAQASNHETPHKHHAAQHSQPREAVEGSRPSQGSRTTYDFEAAKCALESIQEFLDTAKDCKELLPVLDQLVTLSWQHPGAWKPYFKWRDVTSFGQDLLEYFVKDVEAALPESTTCTSSSSVDAVRLLLSRGFSDVVNITVVVGNEIILILSRADPTKFFEQQPKAIQYLSLQLETTRNNKATWDQTMLSRNEDLERLIKDAGASYHAELEQTRLIDTDNQGLQHLDCRQTGTCSDEDEVIRGSIATIFENFISTFGTFNLGPEFLATMADRSFDISPVVSGAWRNAVFQANPFVFTFQCYRLQETDITRALKILVLRSPNSGIFRYPHFSTVLSALAGNDESSESGGNGRQKSFVPEHSGDMLQRLFHSCQGKDILHRVNTELGTGMTESEQVDIFQHSFNLLTYWSLWETARYCVLSRLRTPFGGPQQTLDVLEKHLNSLLQAIHKDETGNSSLSRLRDFLLFLDRLELQFYNAQQGTALGVIPLTPKPSIVFVRSNRKMLDDWFSRIRGRIIEGAKATGEPEITIRNGFTMLVEQFGLLSRGAVSDITSWLVEFERLLVDLVEALTVTNSSDSIFGLNRWCQRAIKDMTKQSNSSKSKQSRSERSTQYPRYKNACLNEGQALALQEIKFDWIDAAVAYAQNRYEQSAQKAMSILESSDKTDNVDDISAPAEFLCQGITNSLSDLSSYKKLHEFMNTIPIDAYANETMLWSEDLLSQSLKEFCDEETNKAWESLVKFYDARSNDLTIPDTFAFDRSGLIGRNFLFTSMVHQKRDLPLATLDNIRQRAGLMIEPTTEFLLYNGLGHASATMIDSLILNTSTASASKIIKEFLDHIEQIPEEMRLNMFHRDVRYWARLDTLANITIKDIKDQHNEDSSVRKQLHDFKFLLSRIARRSECHIFAGSIPVGWKGELSLELQFEEAKAAMAENNYSNALVASEKILDKIQGKKDRSAASFQSKIFLKMAKWSRQTKPPLTEENLLSFERILGLDQGVEQQQQSRIELITSASLEKAVEVGSEYRKSWFEYGTHYYKQGWGILDELGSLRLHHPVATAANESLKEILSKVGVQNPEEHAKNIFGVFVKHCASGQPFEESAAYESIRAHLVKIDELREAESAREDIIDSFKTLLKKILDAYVLAIKGYFKFLEFNELEYECYQPQSKTTTGEDAEVEPPKSSVSNEITATLRLLRLLAKHGGQLYEAFDENLDSINVIPWANIIPQLFARLDHPEDGVRTLISNLLCKIGKEHPQLIVFHCTVGVNSVHNSPCQRRLLRSIGEFLNNSHQELVSQVQHLIRELERVTVLWEEVWHKRIMSSLPELKNTLQELTEQYQNLDAISGLGTEDRHAVMSDNYHQSIIPLLTPLDTLIEQHARPESNHERKFISTYRNRMLAALESLRSPKVWSNLFEGFNLLKDIFMDLGKELSGTRTLKLSDLSPELASIRSSLIDIPSPHQDSRAKIQSFEEQVVVIPTKTKPKKLALIGSDGKRYTYLFKGLEDLHLDERVMQLLRISNGMLLRDKESNMRHLSARHYAVVPLSDSSGMIQWVENTVSMFTIIAKWQNRELMCTRWMSDDNTTGTHPAPQRATEVYHEKAAAALKRAGLPPNHPRRQWPKSILLDLYHEMASETPANLLEREIWSSSPTPAEWWRKSVRFARSTAVMSIIGYVIGLGDRHLDNILIDFTTGDLVHIDYNVCFEKGKRLRIPEIVPFRLTRNMLTSLGVTGTEGNFRIGCENTMKVMRKNKEILVTLLEAFVYDPLVDWQIEATAVQGGGGGGVGVGVGAGGGVVNGGGNVGAGLDSGQGQIRDGITGLIMESESDVSRSSYDANSSSRSLDLRRHLSTESITSVSSISFRSTATIDSSSKRWNSPATAASAADQGDSTPTLATLVNGTSAGRSHMQQQQTPHQQDAQPPQDQQAPHQRNAYAMHVLRRVRHKLEGRDLDPVKKFKYVEQVDRVIQEATNIENLANMYEGWTPWL
ncbi:Serine/threonine-protein kinase smg1 [Mortierella sp. GBA43]|nr:Serine/threonine-protein kinase smg1 [Mortierella sp. GBA43]